MKLNFMADYRSRETRLSQSRLSGPFLLVLPAPEPEDRGAGSTQGLFIIGKCHSEPKAKNLKSLDTDSALV